MHAGVTATQAKLSLFTITNIFNKYFFEDSDYLFFQNFIEQKWEDLFYLEENGRIFAQNS